jgi:hypothetical protein
MTKHKKDSKTATPLSIRQTLEERSTLELIQRDRDDATISDTVRFALNSFIEQYVEIHYEGDVNQMYIADAKRQAEALRLKMAEDQLALIALEAQIQPATQPLQ